MSIPARLPFAYSADFFTARGIADRRVLIDTVDVDVPTLSATECPVVMTWRTSWSPRRPNAKFTEEGGDMFSLRHREGRYFLPVKSQTAGLAHLTADHLPGRGRHDYGVDGSEALGNLYDRHLPGGDDRGRALKGWLTGKFKRQPIEADIVSRSKSDYSDKKTEATAMAARLAVIDGVLHVEVQEPKIVADTYYHNTRPDLPPGSSSCPLLAIFVGEARFGARLPQFGLRQLGAKEESRVVSMRELDDLINEYDRQGTPVLLNFDDLEVSDDLDFKFDGEANRRWRVVSEVVSMLAHQMISMPEEHAMSWLRLRRVATTPENEVTHEALDNVYYDLVSLCSAIDIKDHDRARLLRATEWWNDAPITLEMGGLGTPIPR
jgi:hypothetical protein